MKKENIKYDSSHFNSKAFTLIELLATIIIIGLLAVLTIPKLNRTIKDSKLSVNKASANELVRAADRFFLEQLRDNTGFQGCTYDFSSNINTCNGLEFSGNKPKQGKLNIDSSGKILMAIKFDDVCYVKKYNVESLVIIDGNIDCNENLYYMPQVVTTGDGLYEAQGEDGRLIYRGANPNNYIWLDENGDTTKQGTELYRIVSYETDGTIKVVRNESIGNIAWDERTDETTGPRHNENNTYCNYSGTYYGCNVYGNMNNTYYNGQTLGSSFHYSYYKDNTTTIESIPMTQGVEQRIGTVNEDSTLNKYLNYTWLNTINFKNNITIHSFSVGGPSYSDSYTGGDKGILKEKKEEGLYKWKGKIGLLNITEFVETSLNSTCTSILENYYENPENVQRISDGSWPCSNENWLYNEEEQWTISASPCSYNSVWKVTTDGAFSSYYSTFHTYAVRPLFYLKSDIILSGTGTEENPYKIENI